MRKKAFTIIELILVFAVIGLLGTLTVPMYQSFQITTTRQTFTSELIANLHRAKLKALSAENDDSWSLAINVNKKITIFKGVDFQNREQSYDEATDIPTGVTIESQFSQIIFSKVSGLPNTNGTITLTDSTGQSQIITINPQGTVDY